MGAGEHHVNVHSADTTVVRDGESYKSPSLREKILYCVWDTADKSKEERRLLFKVDLSILSYACLGYFMRTLDHSNISNAYVSGMKESLGLEKNQYILLTTYFTIGYCIFQIPAQMIVTKVNRRWWLPFCEFCWGVCVAGMAGAKNVQTLYALRFLIGVFESTAYCGCMSLLSQWYTKKELAKRVCIFESSIYAASMFSGYLQAALLKNMNGRAGLAAWQWLFIFDFIITLVTVFLGLCVIPNVPTSTKAWFLSEEEKKMAVERIVNNNVVPETNMVLKSFANIFKDPKIYILMVAYTCQICGVRLYTYFNLWLKAMKYNQYEVNIIPTGASAVELVIAMIYGWSSDLLGSRPLIIVPGLSIALTAAIMLSTISTYYKPGTMAGWFLLAAAPPLNGMWQVWVSDLYTYCAEEKMIALGIINAVAFAMVAWIPLYIYPSYEAPFYKYGYHIAILFFGVGIMMAIVMALVQRHQDRSGRTNAYIIAGKKRAQIYHSYEMDEKEQPQNIEVQQVQETET